MAKRKCSCVYATSANTPSVRLGYEQSGYLKVECDACKAADIAHEKAAATRRATAKQKLFDVLVEKAARAMERHAMRDYEWTDEQFEVWWTQDARCDNAERRELARIGLEAAGVKP
jgi:hypothetical protein